MARTEIDDLREHLQRYRAVTVQVLDLVEEKDLAWRPSPDQYSLGQQLLHIAQAEDRFAHGLFEGDWSFERVRFPAQLPDIAGLRRFFEDVRAYTLGKLDEVGPAELSGIVSIPGDPLEHTLRSWLWFILEHELHHRGQVWVYLRALGYSTPFYAVPLPLGQRPDVEAREMLGGF